MPPQPLLPNFVLLGAAKAGSVSLYHYLNQHPQIHMARNNGNSFFALETIDRAANFNAPPDRHWLAYNCVWTVDDFHAQFDAAHPDQVLGDGSPIYLCSDLAAERMRYHVPDAKLIAILRQPAERAFANYNHFRRAGLEPLATFEQALAAEQQRIQLGWGPWPHWFYREIGFYARQINRYLEFFPRDQIKLFLFEDWLADPLKLVQSVYEFVGVDKQFVPDLERRNVGGVAKRGWLKEVMIRPNPLKSIVNALLPAAIRHPLRDRLHRANTIRPTLNPTTRQTLIDDYRADILQLSDIIGRDLSHWLQ